MTSQTFAEFQEHINANNWIYEIQFDRMRPYYESPEAQCFDLPYPSMPTQADYCANLAALLSSRYFAGEHFSGATLWFSDSGVFDGWEFLAGRVVIDRIRAGFGDLRPFDEVEVHNFRADEIELLTAFVILAFVLSWDIFILPDTDRFIHVSHDEFFCIVTKTVAPAEGARTIAGNEMTTSNSRFAQSFCRSAAH